MALTILLADGSAVMRSMLIRTLQLSGLPVDAVHQASSGDDALAAVRRDAFDVALIDLDLPGMDGASLVDAIRDHAPSSSLPCVVFAADGSDARVARVVDRGAGSIRKPFTPEQVRAAVLKVVGARTA
ncbi:MAG: response regulator [Gemmatimonadetes bacterium]|nr:response regulator [Gemmatimonadota bacterium]